MFALVTGGTGFLGSYLVERLRALGHPVRALVRTPAKAALLEALGAELFPGDVTLPDSLRAAASGVDVVFHSAALVSNWGPWADYQAVTVQGTEHLLDAALRANVQRFVHISTVRVYCDRHCRRHGIVAEDAPIGEFGYRQFGNYARAKVLAEAAVWRAAPRLPVTIVRPAWIYGPRDEGIMPPLARWLRDPKSAWPGRANPSVDPIYVTDVADCAIAAALHPGAVGEAFNASPFEKAGVRDFLGLLCERLNIAMPTRTIPYALAVLWANSSEWYAWLTRSKDGPAISRTGLAIIAEDTRFDPSKAERILGWRSQVSLADGVEQTAHWLRARNPELFSKCAS